MQDEKNLVDHVLQIRATYAEAAQRPAQIIEFTLERG
jgi:hypothetical protein